ncbi:MerR family transcriptional regulator [Thermomonospora amylolytica]|uniref:MerR family DNA-binding protein n=1 Tax=Thermomonospora amylolytica TaxID=1411117 RepID=UPI001F487F52|nr:MerR family DNA-binding protein [Thermomonospora amylolytica]
MARVRHIRRLLSAGLPTAAIARVLDCVRDDGGRPVPSGCPGLIDQLRRELHRVGETIERLEESRRALGGLLADALERA